MKHSISKLLFFVYTGVLLPAGGCSSEVPDSRPSGSHSIKVSASIAETLATRSYQAEGKVESGIYYLTYSNPLGELPYNVGTVNFFEGIGIVTAQNGGDLSWDKVGYDIGGNSSISTFFMDNVLPPSNNPAATTIYLDDDNPYIAAKFDYINGSNDLLWGSGQSNRLLNDKVDIDLHHSMAMLRIHLIIDSSKEGTFIPDLSKASMELTNIACTPLSYDRITGTLNLGDNPIYSNLKISSPDFNNWVKIAPDETNENIFNYIAADFILPPQNLASGDLRPRLKISIPEDNGNIRVFSGPLPKAMIVETDNGNVSMNFSFLREHILTLKVTMDPDLMDLQFMPATVVDWVNKGTFLVSGAQSAIYEDSDFMAMIEAYNNNNWIQLEHYGYLSENKWIFNIYSDLLLYEEEFKGKMPVKDGYPYEFKFNGHTITLVSANGEEQVLDEENGGETTIFNLLQ